MRHIVLTLLMIVSTSVWAEWMEWKPTPEGVMYVDPATVNRDGALRRVATMIDLKSKGSDGGVSRSVVIECDCKAERTRTLSTSVHSGPRATGETLRSSKAPLDWEKAPPESDRGELLKSICAD